ENYIVLIDSIVGALNRLCLDPFLCVSQHVIHLAIQWDDITLGNNHLLLQHVCITKDHMH
ncbi:hypothetical protein ACJX0J_029186, partial [Zea mays]